MEGLTMQQIALTLAFLAGLITSIGFLVSKLKEWIKSTLRTEFDGVKKEISTVKDEIKRVDGESCKNYLVTFLAGVEKGSEVDEIELERFWEEYQHYIKIGGNSYIKRKVEKLQEQKKI